MKKIFLVIFFLISIMSVRADDLLSIPYKNIKEGSKIAVKNDIWVSNNIKKDADFFVKKTSPMPEKYTEYYDKNGMFLFTTGCQYDFIYNHNLIGYSNEDLKFYDFTYVDGIVHKRELSFEEVRDLFPEFYVIRLSEFSPLTHSLKLKKNKKDFKIIILNDTNRDFQDYVFTTDNSKIEKYQLVGFLDIKKTGMIQLSSLEENSPQKPWFMLLIR